MPGDNESFKSLQRTISDLKANNYQSILKFMQNFILISDNQKTNGLN